MANHPKKTKRRKLHDIFHDKKLARRGNTVAFGTFGLQAITSAWVTERQIEAARIAIRKRLGKEGQVIHRIFPHFPKTAKPPGVRMGQGKGSPIEWVASVRAFAMMFEVKGASDEISKIALTLGGHKLPVKWKVVRPGTEKRPIKKRITHQFHNQHKISKLQKDGQE